MGIIRRKTLLSGVWNFLPEGQTEYKKIFVPSQWTHGECFGYKEKWRNLMRATYFKNFILPPYTSEHILIIHFDAVMLKCKVYIDDFLLGHHEGGFTPFDITILLKRS